MRDESKSKTELIAEMNRLRRRLQEFDSWVDQDIEHENEAETKDVEPVEIIRASIEKQLEKSRSTLRKTQRLAHVGSWDWDIASGKVEWSEEVYRIFKLDPDRFEPQVDSVMSRFHPDDQAMHKKLIDRLLVDREPSVFEARIVLPNQSIRSVISTSEGLFDDQGKLVRISGTVQDISDLKKAQELSENAHALISKQNTTLDAINRLLRESMSCKTSMEVAEVCLSVALEITGSEYGSVAEVNDSGRFDTLALCNPGWKACQIPEVDPACIQDMEIRGIWGAALECEQGLIINDPANHPERVGLPDGHPALISFLGMPFRHKKFFGMIGIANKRDGYSGSDLEIMSALARVFAEVINNKRHEESLAESERRVTTLLRNLPGMVYRCPNHTDWPVTFVSEGSLPLTGYTAKEFISLKVVFNDLIVPEDRRRIWDEVQTALSNGDHFEIEYRIKTRHGTEKSVLERGMVVSRDENGVEMLEGIILDISKRKSAEDALLLKNQVFENSIAALSIADSDGIITQVNQAFLKLWNYASKEAAIGNSVASFFVKEEEAFSIIDALNTTGRWEGEFQAKRNNGPSFISHGYATTMTNAQGELIGYQSANLDVTEQREAEKALGLSRERLRMAINAARLALWDWDVESNRVVWSKNAEEVLGYPLDAFGETPESYLEKVHPEDLSLVEAIRRKALIGEEDSFQFEYRLVRPDGTEQWTKTTASVHRNDAGKPSRIAGTMEDITERKQLEAQLRQTQKMEAVGTLAGGIAHDFNNILFAILGNTEIAMVEVEDGGVKSKLEEIFKASLRAKDLVQQILSFSRQTHVERTPVACIPAVTESLKLLRATIPSSIDISTDFNCEDDAVLSSKTEIHQILMNLCSNAAQAITNEMGSIEIRLENEEIRKRKPHLHPDLDIGRYVVLTVKDTGSGIPKKNLERIFDPFYTSKGPGDGTGLGLSVIHGIVKELGGGISVDSEMNKGSTFRVHIPCIDVSPDSISQDLIPLPTGAGTLLVVDDEQAIVDMQVKMLQGLGYKVVTETDSHEALRIFEQEPMKFDLVVTDQTMPRMTGEGLAEELLHIRPDIPVILCTGYSAQLTEDRIHELGIKKMLMKPVRQQTLAETIFTILNEVKKT